ncbi:hypothetical protein LP420_20490 [Massilia sp. B-10]|nr:hypothetical protein LP420_20490 [Massilia sp. B-10]
MVDPSGRFDTADLEEMRGLHWVMPGDQRSAVPIELFMRDYYEPRLLSPCSRKKNSGRCVPWPA